MRLMPEEIVLGSGSSFRFGMRLLPAGRRQAIIAIYAFCRAVDDIVDGPLPHASKIAGVDAWQRELELAARGAARTPVGQDLTRAIVRFDLPLEEFALVIDGMRMDLSGMVAPDRATFDAYIRRVAGAVGILSMHVFGAWRGETSRRFALSLARALQMTNILRDVEEDAALGRLYLPADLLDDTGVPHDPVRVPGAPGLPEVRARLATEARAAFTEARREIPNHSRLRLSPALLMMGPYDRLLRRIEADPSRAPAHRGGIGKACDGIRCMVRPGRA
ncbi:farnesyl-diphosphate farnesyltransferase [Palleronia marisminoris]|uniref:All-trans-phytoene synthase n=2 Tax=Palleronia marisminoris TaxID=315423 RepID=A0A1Y5S788_9RHOB|nr:farnesyl-diphosphate farnesyltransferase [Palleronia marisminoris]SLN34024.1 All-trans-phytoene synthase [Palleronia marisminoris]